MGSHSAAARMRMTGGADSLMEAGEAEPTFVVSRDGSFSRDGHAAHRSNGRRRRLSLVTAGVAILSDPAVMGVIAKADTFRSGGPTRARRRPTSSAPR